MEMRCPRCQATNPPQATWCNQCGATFAPAAVGQPAQHQATWGAPGPQAPSPPLPPAPSWGQPGYAPPDQEPPPPDLAGVWPRIGARVVDALLVGLVMGLVRGALVLPGGAAFNLMLVAALVLYETVLLANGGRTLGKMLLGLQVIRADRVPLSPRDALVRSAVIDVFGFVPLGWPIAAIVLEKHRLRQGPHDHAAGTLVVTTRRHA